MVIDGSVKVHSISKVHLAAAISIQDCYNNLLMSHQRITLLQKPVVMFTLLNLWREALDLMLCLF